jgi:hypothetical protein
MLNRDLSGAEATALQLRDPSARDQALYYLAWQSRYVGNAQDADRLKGKIGSEGLRRRLEEVWAEPPQLPALTVAAPPEGRIRPKPYITGLDLTNTTGRMLLYPALLIRSFDPTALIEPRNGPATALLYHLLETYYSSGGLAAHLYPPGPKRDGHRLVQDLLTRDEVPGAHWTIWNTLDRLIGPKLADDLCKRVFFEFALQHPSQLLWFYSGMFLEGLLYVHLPPLPAVGAGLPYHPDTQIHPRFMHEVSNSQIFYKYYLRFSFDFYDHYFRALAKILFVFATLGIFFIRNWKIFMTWTVLWVIALEQLAVCALTAGTGLGYSAISQLLLSLAAVISVHAFIVWMRNRRQGGGGHPIESAA